MTDILLVIGLQRSYCSCSAHAKHKKMRAFFLLEATEECSQVPFSRGCGQPLFPWSHRHTPEESVIKIALASFSPRDEALAIHNMVHDNGRVSEAMSRPFKRFTSEFLPTPLFSYSTTLSGQPPYSCRRTRSQVKNILRVRIHHVY
jgi:hypothetical protein